MIIYLIKNIINNKVYIGQTVGSLNKRKYGHIADSRREKNTKISRAIKKYGEGNFIFGELHKCKSFIEMDDMELYYIKKYNSIDDNYGYNIRIGGENNFKVSDETKLKISIRSKNASKKAKENGKHWSCRKCSEEKKKYLREILTSELNPSNKPVLMYDKYGNFIKRFHSVNESARCIGKPHGNIVSCCNNKLKTAYGYKWEYENKTI